MARKALVRPDPALPYLVEVRLARTLAGMRGELCERENMERLDPRLGGMCVSYTARTTGRPMCVGGHVFARIYLNRQTLRRNYAEVLSHECTHAALAFGRLRGARLRSKYRGRENVDDDEELVCYAQGRLMSAINTWCWRQGVI